MQKKKVPEKKVSKKNVPAALKIAEPGEWKYSVALAGIVLLSFIVYLPVLHNGFVNWDDDKYIQNNLLIRSINLKEIFSHNVMGNYHPLTILAFAVEYHFFGLNETGYHAVNLLLHLLNVILVFYVVFHFSEKAEVALIASLLFGIHPLHVESVAWASELKDLLYTFFFLAAYIFYLKYIKHKQSKNYIFSLLLFSFSLLSKAMAASLPVLLLLTDYFTGRKINIKTLLEKVPFIALSIVLGVFAVMAQDKGGSIDVIAFPFPLRIVFACYGFCSYLLKLILPLKLSSYYPYPIESGVDIPGSYYTAVLFVLGLAVYIFYSLRFSRKIFFGLGFFAVTIFLVLQLLPVGGAMMADRYSYIPSIGVFYLAGGGFYLLWNKKLKWIAIIMLCFFTVLFSVKTYARCGVWKNSLSLWNDVIKQYQTVSIAYYNRGAVYADRKEFEQALADYTKAIQLKPGYLDAYVNRGNIFRDKKMDEEAIQDYIKAIQLQPDFPTAYFNRGTVFMNEKRTDEALNDFDMAIKLKPDFTDAYYNQGNVFFDEKKYEDAISSYTKAINLKTDYASSYYNRGLAEYYSGEKNAACIDLKHAGSLGHHQALEASNKLCN